MTWHCTGTSPTTIYGHIWWKLIYQYSFWPVLGFMVVFSAKNWSKIANLALLIPKIQSGAFILCRHIPNDYLWSYMMETDMPVCVLTCFGVYGDVQGQKLVKNKPKIAAFAPKSRKSNLVPRYCVDISPITIYDHIWWKLIYQYALWPVLGFMEVFRTKNRSRLI